MHIVNSNDTTHTLRLIPREYTLLDVTLILTSEADGTYYTVANSFITTDGIMAVTFDYDFTEKQRFSFILEDVNDNIIYRGKIICLNDNTQDIKQTNDYYVYE